MSSPRALGSRCDACLQWHFGRLTFEAPRIFQEEQQRAASKNEAKARQAAPTWRQKALLVGRVKGSLKA